jgi:hypothetical protein
MAAGDNESLSESEQLGGATIVEHSGYCAELGDQPDNERYFQELE